MNLPNRVYCPSCKEAVFESNVPLKLKGITFERMWNGKRRWYSRLFQEVVHECGVDQSELFEISIRDVEDIEDA